jgi:hypothetical protein
MQVLVGCLAMEMPIHRRGIKRDHGLESSSYVCGCFIFGDDRSSSTVPATGWVHEPGSIVDPLAPKRGEIVKLQANSHIGEELWVGMR